MCVLSLTFALEVNQSFFPCIIDSWSVTQGGGQREGVEKALLLSCVQLALNLSLKCIT